MGSAGGMNSSISKKEKKKPGKAEMSEGEKTFLLLAGPADQWSVFWRGVVPK